FKVIEFNKDSKRIILSHSRIFEDTQKAARGEEARPAKRGRKADAPAAKAEEPAAPAVEKTTLGDIEALAALKDKLEGKK
ncbi:MAG: 30S ribosomal protein S1, partial [Muribaculaceae bacterium]|nr:30S ribosomal protein S1 [Muribaculaceae bacterium]